MIVMIARDRHVQCALVKTKLVRPGPAQIFFCHMARRPSRNSGAKGNYPAYNGVGPVNNNVPITVKKSDNGVRGFLNTDNVIRIQIH